VLAGDEVFDILFVELHDRFVLVLYFALEELVCYCLDEKLDLDLQ
jgi:hypothetical protein